MAETSGSMNKNNLQSGLVKIKYNIDSATTIAYNGNISRSDMKELFNYSMQKDGGIISTDDLTSIPVKTFHELMLMRAFGKNLLAVKTKLNLEYTPSILSIETDTPLLPISYNYQNGLFFLEQNKNQKILNGEIYSSFLLPVHKSYYLKFGLGFDSKQSELENNICNDDIRIVVDSLSNNLSIDILNYYNTIELVKNKGMFRLGIGLTSNIYKQLGNIIDVTKNSTFYRFCPKLELSFIFSSKSKLNLYFNSDYTDNSINNFNNNIVIDSYKSYKGKSATATLFNHKYTNVSHPIKPSIKRRKRKKK